MKNDVWSFGITLLEMLNNKIGTKYDPPTIKILKEKWSRRLPELVDTMLTFDEDKRPTFS